MNLRDWKNPPMANRPAPFWSINDKLDTAETARQMNALLDGGYGGAFFHSRDGLVTPYLGKEWMENFAAALDVARRRGGHLWIYDEDRWPSGNAAGLVTEARPELAAKGMMFDVVTGAAAPRLRPHGRVRATWRYEMEMEDPRTVRSFRRLPPGARRRPGRTCGVVVAADLLPEVRWGGNPPVDLLDPATTREFLRRGVAPYDRFRKDYGRTIPGVFTDEPSPVGPGWGRAQYSAALFRRYRKMFGEDMARVLPLLWLEGPNAERTRWRYWSAYTRQFVEAFTKPFAAWCGRRHLAMTGHYLGEDTLITQLKCVGGTAQPHYVHQQIPGIDHLRNQPGTDQLFKNVTSVARQFGRRRVLCEIFGVSRHHQTFQEMRYLADRHIVNGVGFFCPHLAWYSMYGMRKHDYPPHFGEAQTWWPHIRPVHGYFSRLGMLLERADAVRDILVLNPAGALWGLARLPMFDDGGYPDIAKDVELRYSRLLEDIISLQRDFDTGDEGILAKFGRVEGRALRINRVTYKLIIVPPAPSYAKTTLALLARFAAAGGSVIFVGPRPEQTGWEAADGWKKITGPSVEDVPYDRPSLGAAMDRVLPPHVTVRPEDGLPPGDFQTLHLAAGRTHYLFVINRNREVARSVVVGVPGVKGRAETLDALAGEARPAPNFLVRGETVVPVDVPPGGSVLVRITAGAAPAPRPPAARPAVSAVIPLPMPCRFERLDPNLLVADRMAYSANGGRTWSPEKSDAVVRAELRAKFGLPGNEWQPWRALKDGRFAGKGGRVILKYRLPGRISGMGALRLLVEKAEKYVIRLNGRQLPPADGWMFDRTINTVPLPGLGAGENILELDYIHDLLGEPDAVMVAGDFGVRLDGQMARKFVPEPRHLAAGPWTAQGYPFYVGRMRYHFDFRLARKARCELRLAEPVGSCFVVRVNGGVPETMYFPPWTLDISRRVRAGMNAVSVEVVGSLQNAFGPMHHVDGARGYCGPGAFNNPGQIIDRVLPWPHGIGGAPEIALLA
ncbi:MAG: hypothetical protein V1809_12805 [Planctomycetota bacterium]